MAGRKKIPATTEVKPSAIIKVSKTSKGIILLFIDNLINKKDDLKNTRISFRNDYLIPESASNASVNIFNQLKAEIIR